MMERHNPLLDPRPDDPIDQIHAYARDWAYMVVVRASGFHAQFNALNHDPHDIEDAEYLPTRFRLKWGGRVNEGHLRKDYQEEYNVIKDRLKHDAGLVILDINRPSFGMLVAFGYLTAPLGVPYSLSHEYRLTEKAFQLLDRPSQPSSIFISYRRRESSAFALLIEARLQLKGSGGIFIDRDIPGGVGWERHIKEQIEKSEEFIVLLGKTAFEEGSWVGYELEWAQQTGCRIIPVWHNEYTLDAAKKHSATYAKIVSIPQGYTLKEESALAYDTAIIWLLNTLGYRS